MPLIGTRTNSSSSLRNDDSSMRTEGKDDEERQSKDGDRNRMMETRRRAYERPRATCPHQNALPLPFRSAALWAPDVRGGGRLPRGSRTHPGLPWDALRAEEGRRRARSKTRRKAAEQSYCTGRHSSLYRPRLAQGLCLRERQQLVGWAPVSSMPFCGLHH